MKVCDDGFVRITLDALLSMPLRHFLSGIDGADVASVARCGTVTDVSGYTEWLSDSACTLVMGWDWTVDIAWGAPRWLRIGPPRTNIMLVDDANRDLGWRRNSEVLSSVVDAMNWQPDTQEAVANRCA
jgi:hypothetical protein